MLEEWGYHKFIKNWQKNIAGFLVTLFLVTHTFSQSIPEFGREIDTKKGLPNNVVRKTWIDNSGSTWVGTDGGLSVFPKHNQVNLKICSTVGRSEVWDIYQISNRLYVGSYNQGIFIFDLASGNLIKKIESKLVYRFRKFKFLQNHLFVISGKGLKELKGTNLITWLDSHPQPKQKKYFTIDVFSWQNKFYLSFFPYNPLLVFDNGTFLVDKGLLGNYINKNPSEFIMLAQEFENKLICANSYNGYFTFDKNGKINRFNFQKNKAENTSFIIWDMLITNGKLIMAVGNTENFEQGFIYQYKNEINQQIHMDKDQIQHFVWSLTEDPWKRGIWACVVNYGAYFYPNYETISELPFKATQFFSCQNSTLIWNDNFIGINTSNTSNWHIIKNQWNIRNVLGYGPFYIVHCDEGVFLIHSNTNKIKQISKKTYSSIFIQNTNLHLVQYFSSIESYNFLTEKISNQIETSVSSITSVTSNKDLAVLFGENLGYLALVNDTIWKIKLPHNISLWHHDFYLVGKLLIIKDGETLHCLSLNTQNRTITNYFTVNLKSTFYSIPIDWIQSSESGLWIGNSQIALQIKLDELQKKISVLHQFYLGNSILIPSIQFCENDIKVLRDNFIQTFQINNKKPNFNLVIEYPKPNFSGYNFPLLPENQNFKMELISNDYLTDNYSIFEYDLATVNTFIHHRYLMSTNPFWTNDLKEASYQASFKLNSWTKSIPIRIERFVYQRFEFGLLVFISLFMFGYYVYTIQTDQFKMRQRLLQMELSTLKSNFNPHFIFNTMNLIQSLIVQNDKKRALKASSELAHLNRLFLETSNLDFISLSKEIELAKKYVDLEKLRFENDREFNFEVKIENHLNLFDWIIPPLILQPLLENALKHGVLIVKSESKLGIKMQIISPNELHLNIYNSYDRELLQNKTGMGMGRALVENRIKLFNQRFFKRWAIEFGSNADSNLYHCHIIITKFD